MARRPKSAVRTIDFSEVGDRITAAEGLQRLRVEELTIEEGDKAEYYKWKFVVVGGDSDGAEVYTNTSLAPQSLWNLKALLEAFGVEIEDELKLDPADFIGAEVMGEVFHERYQGQTIAKVNEFSEAEEEKPAKKTRGRKKAEEEEDEDPKPTARRRGRKPAEEEEEEEPAPKRRGRKPAAEEEKPATRRGRKKAEPEEEPEEESDEVTEEDILGMSQDELEEFCEENDLDVDFESIKSLKKMRAAVVDAAEEADLI